MENRWSRWEALVREAAVQKSSWLRTLWSGLQRRAVREDIGCSLTYDDLVELCVASQGRCAISGIYFSDERPGGVGVAPFRPSLNRIDSSKGFTRTNLQLICLYLNPPSNEEVVYRVGMSYVSQARMNPKAEPDRYFGEPIRSK